MNSSMRQIIKSAIAIRGSQRKAAEVIGVKVQTLCGWLNNHPGAAISQEKIDRLCIYCQLHIETDQRIIDLTTGDIIYDHSTGKCCDSETIEKLQDQLSMTLSAIKIAIDEDEIRNYNSLKKMNNFLKGEIDYNDIKIGEQ